MLQSGLTAPNLSAMLNQMVEYQRSELDAVYAALSHPVRRSLLEHLTPRGARVTELAAPYPMSLAAVSKHIRVLESAGLVRRTIVGREHQLALEPTPLMSASTWLDSYRRFWDDRLDLLEARLRQERSVSPHLTAPARRQQ
jgi:DNA-binding transcriptional ArsR family regulator